MMRIAALLCVGSITVGCAETADLSLDGRDGIDGEARDGASDDGSEAADADAPDGGCPPGRTPCSGACVDVTSDPANCGSCGRRCDAGEVCNEGICASTCTGGLRNCSGACVDVNANRLHCGDCDRPCAANEECRAGGCVCVPACAGRTCGPDGCGGSCPPGCGTGFTCSATGTCTCSGTVCGSACCSAGQVCNAGACCTPNCAGRTCGPDGCGGSCPPGCGTGFTCSATGTCTCSGTVCGAACCPAGQVCISGQCCSPNWRRDFPDTFLKGIAADPDGTFIAVGSVGAGLDLADGHQALAIQIDACGREVDREAFMPTGAVRARANAVAVSRTHAYVAGVMGPSVSGGGATDGFVTRVAKSPLPVGLFVEIHVGLWGGDLNDEIGDVAIADDGSLWLAGVTEAAPAWANHCAWTVKGNAATGAACGWNPFGDCTADSAWSVAAVPASRRVYLAGRRGAGAFLAGWSSSECSTVAPCPCAPSVPAVTFAPVGALTAEGRAIATGSTDMHVAGYSEQPGGDYAGMVARIASGRATVAPPWNPTARMDGFLAAGREAGGAGGVIVAGVTNWDGSGTSATATGAVVRYNPSTLAVEWTAYPVGAGACWDVAFDAAGGIVVACVSPTSSSVRRCTPAGVCP